MHIRSIVSKIILILLVCSCKTSKKTTTQTKELEQIKSEIFLKVDSFAANFKEVNRAAQYQNKIDTTTTDFEISFKPNEVGKIDLSTPQGNFSAVKSGNGSIVFKGKSKSLKSNKKETSKIQTFEKNQTKTQATKKQKAQRQSQTKSKELHSETKAPWYLSLWWLWLIVGVFIYWVVIKKHPIVKFFKNLF